VGHFYLAETVIEIPPPPSGEKQDLYQKQKIKELIFNVKIQK
jgi:hypothetical protein